MKKRGEFAMPVVWARLRLLPAFIPFLLREAEPGSPLRRDPFEIYPAITEMEVVFLQAFAGIAGSPRKSMPVSKMLHPERAGVTTDFARQNRGADAKP
jgi:hypothetical protein